MIVQSQSGDAAFPIGRAILGGVAGSVVMAMWAMMVAAISGMGFWAPVQLIAAVWLGSSALMHLSATVILVGLMTHMMMGAILGLVLASIFQVVRTGPGPVRLVWGMVYSLVVWVLSQYVILPAIDPMMASHMPPWAFALGHLMFGVVTAAFLLYRPASQFKRQRVATQA